MFFVRFPMRFARFQIVIYEPQSIWHKLLVLRRLYQRLFRHREQAHSQIFRATMTFTKQNLGSRNLWKILTVQSRFGRKQLKKREWISAPYNFTIKKWYFVTKIVLTNCEKKIVVVIEKKLWNSRLKAENLQNFWDH